MKYIYQNSEKYPEYSSGIRFEFFLEANVKRINYVDYEKSIKAVQNEIDLQLEKSGRVTNMKKTLLNDLTAFKAYQEWYPLNEEIEKFIGDRGAMIFSHAISSRNECLLCSTFFRKILIERGEDPANLKLDDREKILVEFGIQLAKDANGVSDELFGNLKKYFDERQIVLLTAFAGIMIATNVFNSALRIELDDYLENFR
jgi:alkylhydroperoxidase family enzyme